MKLKIKNYNKIYCFIVHRTPLHLAVMKGNIKIIQLLLSRSDINLKIKDDIFFLKFFYKISLYLIYDFYI